MKLKDAFGRKVVLMLFILFAVGMLFSGCGEKKVASVNGEAVTQKAFEQRFATVQQYYEANLGMSLEEESGVEMLKYLQEMVLDQMITEHLLLQEARKQGIEVEKEEVQQRIDQDKLMVGGEKAYADILKNQLKMSEREYAKEVEKQVMIEKLYEQTVAGITVEAEEVERYYEENMEQFDHPEQVRARHILVDTEEEGKAIIEQLNNGADFAQLAMEKSLDPTAQENQGDLNYFSRESEFDAQFTEAAFKLKTGEITLKPVKTGFGYHVIKVEDRQDAHQQTLEEVKDTINDELRIGKESEKFQQYVDELRQQAKIEKEELPTPTVKSDPNMPSEGSSSADQASPNQLETGEEPEANEE